MLLSNTAVEMREYEQKLSNGNVQQCRNQVHRHCRLFIIHWNISTKS